MTEQRSTPLAPDRAADLRAADLTYRDVGATLTGLPSGYHHLHHDGVVGRGRERFEHCAAAVLAWQVQLRSGARVASTDDPQARPPPPSRPAFSEMVHSRIRRED